MESMGVHVDRPTEPLSMHASDDEKELSDPQTHPIRVRVFPFTSVSVNDLYGFFVRVIPR